MTTVGVVIPCRNEARWLHEVLEGLEEQDHQADDVVVVDDGSTDETAQVLEMHRRLRRLPTRIVPGPGRGVAAAVNTGISALATDIVIRLDGHSRPAADYIARAVALTSRPDVGVAGGVWTIQPGAGTIEAAAIAIAAAHPMGSGGALYRTGKASTLTDVDTVPFGCFRRSLWQTLAGLDETLRANEDYEFNYRVRLRSLRIVLDPGMHCTYFSRPTVRALAHQYLWYGWWKARMLVRYPASARLRQLIAAILLPALVVQLLWSLVSGGWWWMLPALYPATVAAASIHAAAVSGRWSAIGWLMAAFVTMHLTWSSGFCASLMTSFSYRRPAA